MMNAHTYKLDRTVAAWSTVSAMVDLQTMVSGAFIRPNHHHGSGVT
ncbi:MAG: hypothetical protein JWM35_983 [Verrucomicrobia bacterium]|nr:hypothetical protein [Verrucomicrobiota bacterium]